MAGYCSAAACFGVKMECKEIKLAVFDLDGTLLNSKDSLEKDTILALRALYHRGVRIMLCTGRVPSMVEAYLFEIGIEGICACANGAYIVDNHGSLIYQKPIPSDMLLSIVELFAQRRLTFSLMAKRDIYTYGTVSRRWDRFERYEELARNYNLPFPRLLEYSQWEENGSLPIYKIPVMELEKGELKEELKLLNQFSDCIAVTRSGPKIIDITAVDVSKGTAVRTVAGHLGIQKDEICCMGDYDNDVWMFKEAGISIAMGNAPDRVKSAADYVTEDHNKDGAAEAIARYILPLAKGGIYADQMD